MLDVELADNIDSKLSSYFDEVLENSEKYFLIPLALIILGVGGLVINYANNGEFLDKGTDFAGGTEITFEVEEDFNSNEIEALFADAGRQGTSAMTQNTGERELLLVEVPPPELDRDQALSILSDGGYNASIDGFENEYYYGRRPTQPIMPSFRNVYQQDDVDFQGKYLIAFGAARSNWTRGAFSENIGSALKQEMQEPGGWGVFMMIQGETIPRYENHVRLSESETDPWGVPQLITSIGYTENDENLLQDFLNEGAEMLESAGCKNIGTYDSQQAPGLDIHEMGGARMGTDPETSILNGMNQIHSCKNVFVTDGSCMTSAACQNPSLTYMALTARAANYAADQLKKGNL